MNLDIAKKLLIYHEGLRLKPYRCEAGKLTIGVGRNIEDIGITEREAMFLLTGDLLRVQDELKANFSFYIELSSIRQLVMVDMCFNLGISRFRKFKKMISALKRKDFDEAAKEMLDSRWARQVKSRSARLANMMRLNELPPNIN